MRLTFAIKRLFDVTSCLAIGGIVAPAFPLLAAAVRWQSPGPIFFVQQRAGKGGKPFKMYKFRTMHVAPASAQSLRWSKADEQRITRFGALMRDYGLDEFPQLVNILRGDMSVIGPRPPLPAQVEHYSAEQRRMFEMRPGVLSLAAIRGRRSLSPEERIAYHVEYVREWSLKLDLHILLSAAWVVLGRQDAKDALRQEEGLRI